MEQHVCLNCGTQITGNFCTECGQKSDTHRITLKNFIRHDLVHGLWHLDTGILFTLKETIIRPGEAALDYIHGKRIRYYNVFYLCLLIIALNVVLRHWYHDASTTEQNRDSLAVGRFFSEHIKSILLGIIPCLSINSLLFFRKLKLNFAEHCIVSGFCLLGMLMGGFFYNIFNYMNTFDVPLIFGILEFISFFSIPVFAVYTYYNLTKHHYKFWGFTWRFIAFSVSLLTLLLAFLSVIIMLLTDGSGQVYVDF